MTRTSIDVQVLREMLERGEPVTVLDVRPEDQSSEWWIPGRVHFDAYGALKANDPDAMLDSLTNEQIAARTGRSVRAVTVMRSRVQHTR